MIVWVLAGVEAAALVLAILLGMSSSTKSGGIYSKVMHPRESTWGALRASGLAPLVLLIAYALTDEIAIEVIRLHLAGAPRPFTGGDAVAYHVSVALVLGWPCALACASWRVFAWPAQARAVSQHAVAWWAGVVAAMVYAHPVSRAGTGAILHGFEVLAVVAAVVPIPLAWRRPWGRPMVAVGLLVATECAVAAIGPWVRDVFRDWRFATSAYLLGFATLAGLLGRWLRRDRHDKA